MVARHRPSTPAGVVAVLVLASTSCTGASPPAEGGSPAEPSRTTTAASATVDARVPVQVGEPVDVAALTGRIVLSTEDDIYAANANGTGLDRLTRRPGPEFDPSWSPDGRRIVYRDSRRGINDDDEIFVMNANGSGRTNVTTVPSNDWGPEWSPDGDTIVFNSDRRGSTMGGFLMSPNGSNLRRIPTDLWVEYPTWSPDGERIAFMGGESASEYDIWTVDLDGTNAMQLTDSPGPDGWPAWSPDGTKIAFTSVRDDCAYSDAPDCRTTGDVGEHHDVWVVNGDGTGLARVTAEFGQFVTWSPDGEYLLVSGFDLFVIRPDGTGRASLDIAGFSGSGLHPDWVE